VKLPRFRFSLATLLIAVTWSAVVVWMNVTPRAWERGVGRGYPLFYTSIFAIHYFEYEPPCYWDSWSLAWDAVIALLLVVVLTWVSKFLLRHAGFLGGP
jgi:hypothetical protein